MAGSPPESSLCGRKRSCGSSPSRRRWRTPPPHLLRLPDPTDAAGIRFGSRRGFGTLLGASCKEEREMARTAQEAAQLTALLNKKYRYFDYKWDLIFWVTALPIVAAAADITKLLFAGDWDFWTDWKDRQWWVTITPFAMIIIPSAIQYIQWLA